MILRPVRWAVSIFVSFAVAWFTFMVPFGRFTLFQHASRIFATDEAQELTGELGNARARLTDEVVRQVGEVARVDGGPSGLTMAAETAARETAERLARASAERARSEAERLARETADHARAEATRRVAPPGTNR